MTPVLVEDFRDYAVKIEHDVFLFHVMPSGHRSPEQVAKRIVVAAELAAVVRGEQALR